MKHFDIDNGETLCVAYHNKNKQGRPLKKRLFNRNIKEKARLI